MALFKILKGKANDLPTTYHEGYCYFTTDTGKFYIDISNTQADSSRVELNAATADTALVANSVAWSNVSNKPNSGSYVWSVVKKSNGVMTIDTNGTSTDVTVYSLPTASSSTLGGIKVGSNLSISDGVLSGKPGTVTSITLKAGEGISLDTNNTAITSSGTRTITNTGVRSVTSGSTNGTINVNTNGTNAEVAVKGLAAAAYKGVTDNSASTAITSSDTNLITARTLYYAGYVKSSGVTSITLKAGTGISLDTDNTAITSTGTRTITNTGVRSVGTGSTNGTISVNTGGTTTEVAVKGLGSNAYTSTAYIPTSQKGAASGVAPLNDSSKIDATYLPSYVDDVLEYASTASFPETGTSGIIYLAQNTGFIYRWAETQYVNVSADTNTTYTLATGDNSGEIKITPSIGTGYNVKVKNIAAAAYKEITDNSTSTAVTSSDTNLITARTLYYAGYVKSSGVTSITLKAGGGISLDTDNTAITSTGTRTITNTGVRAVSTGSTNGTINVNTNGTSAEVAVKGLAAAAYKAVTDNSTSTAVTSTDTNLITARTLYYAGYVKSSGVTSITLKAGSGISLDTDNTAITSTGTRTITNTGVRSIATGSGNGTINVNTGGTTADIAVKGLAAAAYKSVTDNSSATAIASDDTNLITGRTLYYAGYVKSSGVTSITLKAGDGISLNTDNTAITSTGTRTITNTGVRSITKKSNGVLTINTGGTSADMTVYSLPTAAADTLGGIKVGSNLSISEGVLSGKPGTVTSITLKAGTGISLDTDNTAITSSGTRTITNTGVRSITNSNANGTISVNTGGTTSNITIKGALHYIVGPSTDTTAGTWTGTDDTITEYYDGLTIVYVPHIAGASTTTLNINNLGAKTCYFTNTSKLTTHFSVNTPILLTYYGGYWKRADYDSNTNTQIRVYRQNSGYNDDYPLLVSRTIASEIGTSGTNSSYTGVYGIMWDDITKVPTLNPSTGAVKATSFVGTATGNLTTVDYDSTNHRFIKKVGPSGTTTEIVTIATLKSELGLGTAAYKNIVTSIDTSASLPTSGAVKTFVEGKNYVTSSGVTSITLKAGDGISLDIDDTAITSTGTRTISHADTSSQSSVTASSRRYITAVTLDTYGHVTGLSTGTETVTDTWRGIQDNLTSSTNTEESLSAKQGYLLASGSARDSTKVLKTGDTMTGNLTLESATGNSPAIIFNRGTSGTALTDWKIYVTSGKLSFCSASDNSTYTERAYFKDASGDFVASSFTGSGASLTSLNASNISSGTLNAARLPSSGVSAASYGPSENASPAHNGTFNVPYFTVDAYGRITAASTKTITLPSDNNDNTTYSFGHNDSDSNGTIRITPSVGTSYTVSPKGIAAAAYKGITDNSSSTAVSNTDTNLITARTLYYAGYVKSSGVTSITLKAGNGISLDTDNTAITSTGTRTISHADTSSQASSSNSGRTYIQSITLDTYGHVTGLSTASETVTNTDTLMTQNYSTTNSTYPLLMSATSDTVSTNNRGAITGIVNNSIYANPFTGTINATTVNATTVNATTFSGTVSNATTTEDALSTLYPIGVTSSAITTLKRDTSITMAGGNLSATAFITSNYGSDPSSVTNPVTGMLYFKLIE